MTHSWVEINLENLAWNYRLIAGKAGSDAGVLAVVKANAYGHGMAPVSRALVDLSCRWFGVASVTEGAQLRHVLPDANILVLGYIAQEEIGDLLENDLVATISSVEFAEELNARAQRMGKRACVHLKLDTGMGRLGFFVQGLEESLPQLSRMSFLEVEGVLSHFSGSDEEDLAHSHAQFEIFDQALQRLREAGFPLRWFHLANSNAIFRIPNSHFNLVRSGLFLYGLMSDKGTPHRFGLRPVLEWKSRVGLIKEFNPGQTVSYGRTHRVKDKTRIAVIPVGYADGFNRRLSNCGKVLIRGQFAPVVGRVTMDHIMVDVGHIADVQEGDEVVLIGRQGDQSISCEDMADWLGTISYEVVCAIGPRVERKVIFAERMAVGARFIAPAD